MIAEEGSSGPELSRFSDATQTDPLVVRTLEPGEYHLHVRGFNRDHTPTYDEGGELRAWVPGQVDLGSTTEISFDEEGFGGTWKGWVHLPDKGRYTVTAERTDEHTQPVLNVIHAREGLDQHGDLPDLFYLYDIHVDGVAQVQQEIPAGNYVVMVAEGMGLEGTATITIEGP